MKIKIRLIDDSGKELEGEIELSPKRGSTKKKSPPKTESKTFIGLHGGINFLLSQNFLSSPKSVNQITEELKKEGYYHSKESVDKALRIDFVTKKKILTRIKEKNLWHYVIRK